jgi:hypothetical protein
MVRTRTTDGDLVLGALDAVVTALRSVDIIADLRHLSDRSETDWDAEVDMLVDDRVFPLRIEVKSYCTGQVASQVVNRTDTAGGASRLLVADRITSDARFTLDEAGWSWLDRRGRLHLRAPGVRIDVDVPATDRSPSPTAGPPIRGRSGLTVAYWLCVHPGGVLSPNRSAPDLRLAPSTISTTVRSLAEAGLVDESGAGIAPELFWELAAVWSTERTWLLRAPDPTAHLPVDPGEPSWRITGTAAAAYYGAPVVAAGEGPIELYVNGPVEVSIAARRYGAAEPGTGVATVAVPPTSLVNDLADGELMETVHGWPVAPMVAVALDLALDRSRGHEILDDWEAGRGIWI